MNHKPLNPNWAAAILVAIAIVTISVLPISIQVKTNDAAAQESTATALAPVEYTLRTQLGGTPPMAFVGVGGTIEGVVNPDLTANTGQTVRITVINGDPIWHDMTVDAFGVSTGQLLEDEQTATVEFMPMQPGEFRYRCSVPGHEQVGMWGRILVSGASLVSNTDTSGMSMNMTQMQPTAAPADPNAVSIVRNPVDVPAPIGDREPTTVRFDLTTVEVNGILADGTTYNYFTFDGKVPGPMLRVRVGDTVEMHIHNDTTSLLAHSIDLHAVTGPGGGAVYTQTNPGEETTFTFQTLNPGLFVYHCATPSVAHHMASGMYGLILVEPEGGLPPVDREFYVMQGEIYTAQPYGTQGQLDFSHEAMLDEDPEYFVFNGMAMGLTLDENALHATVGETVRIYFGVGGPNATSSFHVIGEIFDRVYDQASLTSAPLTDVQTTLVPPGGATMVEFTVEVPGRYILVDHALSRLERGLAGFLYVEGEPDDSIFYGPALTEGSGH